MTFSLTYLETEIKAALVRTQAKVEQIVTAIATDIEVGIADLQGASNWLAGEAPAIAAALTSAVALTSTLGATSVPAVAAAAAEAQAAATALTAFAAAHNAGKSTPASVVQGYVAYVQSTGAVNAVKAAAITAKADATLATVASDAKAIAATVTAIAPASTVATQAGDVAAAVVAATATASTTV